MKQLKYNYDMIARLSDLLFRISNDVRGVGKHAFMVQTPLEQVSKSQRELLEDKQRFKLGRVDTSPTYLLFLTLFLLFWTLICMI